jgi:hypothetical protein
MFVDERGLPAERVFEVFPYEYRDWAHEQRIPKPPPDARLVRRPTSDPRPRRTLAAIISPNNGDYFKIDPVLRKAFQTVQVRALVPPTATRARLVVNGESEADITSGAAWWQLKRGQHQFRVLAMVGEKEVLSRPVTIMVE